MVIKINEEKKFDQLIKEKGIEISIIDSEVLNEICVYSDTSSIKKYGGICIRCDPSEEDRNLDVDPYIKIGNKPTWDKSDKAVRVHLKDMRLDYSHKRDRDGKHRDPFILKTKDKKNLNEIMKLSNTIYPDLAEDVDVFESIVLFLGLFLREHFNKELIPLKRPDFLKCYEED